MFKFGQEEVTAKDFYNKVVVSVDASMVSWKCGNNA